MTYPGSQRPALRDVALRLETGRLVGVVGPSGSGKSTLAAVLLRFVEPASGSLWIDGTDAATLDPDVVRQRIAYAEQRTRILTGTVRESLAIADPDADEGAMVAALQAVGLGTWLAAVPSGLDGWVGEHGRELSGGERQRLALARVLLRPSPLVVLDEPGAHLDPENERGVMDTVARLARDRAVLLLSHRLSCLRGADEIVVLRDGAVIERGTFGELTAAGGWFARGVALERAADAVEGVRAGR